VPYRVIVLGPSPAEFTVAPGETLLAAARAQGVALRSACRNGTCRECRCLVIEGRLRHTIPWPGLSAEEKLEGWALPCVAEAESDLVLQGR
jgi:ferredoxin